MFEKEISIQLISLFDRFQYYLVKICIKGPNYLVELLSTNQIPESQALVLNDLLKHLHKVHLESTNLMSSTNLSYIWSWLILRDSDEIISYIGK